MKTRVIAVVLAVLLVSLAFSGCSLLSDSGSGQAYTIDDGGGQGNMQQPAPGQYGANAQPGLLESGNNGSDPGRSVAQVNIGGTSVEFVLTNCFGSLGWNATYSNIDGNGKNLGAVTLTIPMGAKEGDVFRQDDPADYVYGNGSVMYYNARAGKSYLAMDTAAINPDYDSLGLKDQSAGNEFAIAIDSVSNNGMLITGRFAARFIKSTDGQQEDIVISDSTFTLDLSGAQTFTPEQGGNTDIDSFFNGDDLRN